MKNKKGESYIKRKVKKEKRTWRIKGKVKGRRWRGGNEKADRGDGREGRGGRKAE